jgi:carboxymethylenebutenolidase
MYTKSRPASQHSAGLGHPDPELASLRPLGQIDRRGFMVTTLATGFALAAGPISAQTITTDSEGLTAGPVTIPVKDGEIPAYRAAPAQPRRGGWPIVLVVQEIFGVHEHIKDICRRFAKLGFLAIAPELYARQGDVSKLTDIAAVLRDVVAKVPDAQVMSDLDAAAHWAMANGGNARKLAVTGFCWGGRIVWLYAAHNKNLKAGVAWYGRLVGAPNAPANDLQPRQPIELVSELHAPVLGLYGGKDTGISVESVEQMRTALAGGSTAAKHSHINVYPEAGHGFNADYRPSYNAEAAKAGFEELKKWFAQQGVS